MVVSCSLNLPNLPWFERIFFSVGPHDLTGNLSTISSNDDALIFLSVKQLRPCCSISFHLLNLYSIYSRMTIDSWWVSWSLQPLSSWGVHLLLRRWRKWGGALGEVICAMERMGGEPRGFDGIGGDMWGWVKNGYPKKLLGLLILTSWPTSKYVI